ncbi:hypothetical protein HLPCO_003106 [Haloplasma contractile SSD-17B]|uniref:Uncharacterized protein n=1 Tax=Haloplasma contractile SSD-17B TaxID=1033810 RepID=F7PSB7_9MOLU|nr:hypothetical protein HLPCO_003106 [Haloplasma contractile SSD-17B]
MDEKVNKKFIKYIRLIYEFPFIIILYVLNLIITILFTHRISLKIKYMEYIERKFDHLMNNTLLLKIISLILAVIIYICVL